MKSEPSKLARLVVTYHERFGVHVPIGALQTLDAEKLAPLLETAIATGVALPESGWEPESRSIYPRGGCCIVIPDPRKRPDGAWLH